MADFNRRAELGKIHIAKKQLGFDDDTYRDAMEKVTGKRSAAELTSKQRGDFLDYLQKAGFKKTLNKSKTRTKPAVSKFVKTHEPQIKKILAQWKDIAAMGGLNNPDASVLAFLKKRNVTDVDNINWITPAAANKAVEILKKWIKRLEAKDVR